MKRFALLIEVLALASVAMAQEPLVVVDNGQPRARIVLPPKPAAEEKLAADELQTYVAKITGAQLPISSDASAPGAKILLGVTDSAKRQALRLAELKYDGFVMRRESDALILAGNLPVGTLNAAYAFLERLGVRWYLPTELGENVPHMATLAVRALDVRDEPRFACRRNHGIDISIRGEGAAWRRLRRRCACSGRTRRASGCGARAIA